MNQAEVIKKSIALYCEEGSLTPLKEIFKKNLNLINETDQHGMTPFFLAIKNHHLNVASYLHSEGADINAKNRANQSALFWAAANNELEIAKYLLDLGANINCSDNVNSI